GDIAKQLEALGVQRLGPRVVALAFDRAGQVIESRGDAPRVAERTAQLEALLELWFSGGVVAVLNGHRAQVAEGVGDAAGIAEQTKKVEATFGERPGLRVIALDEAEHAGAGQRFSAQRGRHKRIA